SLAANDSVNSLKWITSPDSLHIWSVGDVGSIMSSSDGGNTWTHLDQRARYTFTEYDEASISFPDSLHGWIAGGDSVLLHTDNGGQFWVRQPTQFGKKIRSVSFPDEQHGWAIMDSTGGHCVIRTEDGGQTWQLVYAGLNEIFFDVFFISPYSGWLAGYEGIIKHTSDGGYTWTTQHADPYEKYLDLFFLDSLNGWAAGGSIYWDPGIILHTNDGGTTWEQQYEGSECFSSICFANLSHGWAVNYHECFKTENGGLTWEMFSDTSLHMKSVTCGDPMHVYMAGTTGAIFYSSDGGTSWCLQDSHGTSLYAIHAIDSTNAYAFGLNGIVIHTSNGGSIPVGIFEIMPTNEMDQQQLTVFPNPASSYTEIELVIDDPTNVELYLFDQSGRLVSQKPIGMLQSGRNKVKIDVSHYPTGLYICYIILQDKIHAFKIVIEN
ncbi:MAG: YCF48-related protein, partial [Bacteroidota bacterium]